MKKTEYLEQRNSLLAKAKEFVNQNKLEDSAKIRDQISLLDETFEKASIERANLEAMTEQKPINITDLGVKVEGEKIVEILETELENAELKGFESYIRSKGDIKNNVTSTDVGVLIPKEVIYQPQEEAKTVTDLAKLVNRVPVTTGSGTYPILKRATAGMSTVAELAANPELAKPVFLPIDWKVETYRGHIAISQESIDDSEVDLMGIVGVNTRQQKINTTNSRIANVMKTFTAKTVSNTDGIKDIFNVELDPAYNVVTVATQSFFNELDKMKDKNDRYLLSDNIASPSGKQLLGKNVIVVSDEILGAAKGDKVAFIGDVKEAIFMADRKDVAVEWLHHEIYGKYLGLYTRFDIKAADVDAGFFVTFTPAATGE